MSEVIESMRNTKKVYKNELTVSNEAITDLTAKCVIKKRVLKTGF